MSEAPTSPESPWPVRTVARKISEWVDRLGAVWVEGQLAQVTARPGTGTAFLTLRDPAADVSLQLTCPVALVREGGPAVAEGNRVIVHGKPSFFLGRGTLSLRVDRIQAVGLGELLARIERLRRLLAAEGLFDVARKRPLPFLPGCIGLVTGRASAAEHDVVSNATARWPSVRFRIEHTATQGGLAVAQIVDALGVLDRDPGVDVIVLARGGGSVEDLLPFSDETLCRAVADCRTPVVSAIGHEPDTPLVDHVADLRCSTPTEAGRRLVPDLAEESARIAGLRDRARRALHGWVDREQRLLTALRARPVLADPLHAMRSRHDELERMRERARGAVEQGLDRRTTEVAHLRARLTTLGPAATLARGYAIVQRVPGSTGDTADRGVAWPVLRSAGEVGDGDRLRIRVADGAVTARVDGAAATGRPATRKPAARRPRKKEPPAADAAPAGKDDPS
ncbi:exodeoxyribonuclease VII large subunit [Pseudonocardia sp. N23]|uniref:exodeoxyribonuclease VII large subunit n=1 Tax=Pseudonocardia sp. N23 TaxID=1987376 RepID=UPI000BFE1331|nr:exodeoxyribonuclease VII large subunit [Pseudonocardia sp. N23]GAY13149.1 exodeoxyribonuclease VII large subunit [Pseudonocardia sp. N23]